MSIIKLKNRLTQLFNSNILEQQARSLGFTKRLRPNGVHPMALVASLVAALGKGNAKSIADLHRQFNGMQLTEDDFVEYKPFHNQLKKQEFPKLMELLAKQAMVQLAQGGNHETPEKFKRFKQVLLQDGSSLTLHAGLASVFPGRFTKTAPAAVECHMTMSLFAQAPTKMTIAADTKSEHDYVPQAHELAGSLLLADAGYVNLDNFASLAEHGAGFLVRGKKSLNPKIIEAYNGKGRRQAKVEGKRLKEVSRRTNRSEVLDMTVEWKKLRCRAIRRWFPEERKYVIWLTNLERDEFSAEEVMSFYRCRWQIELLFKELKSDNNMKKFATQQKAIVEGLIWASLLTLILKRLVSKTAVKAVSWFKAAKNADVWFLPIMQALYQRELYDIEEQIIWAFEYLKRNALPAQQSKSKQGKGFREILAGL